jgi:hypothetical protein
MSRKTKITLAVLSISLAAMLVAQSAGGVKWTPPKRWSMGPANQMRVATYKVPAAAGDPEAGECKVNYFGSGQGGPTDANITRWKGQFQTAGGQPITDAKTEKLTISGFKVTTLDISGTFTDSSGPMMAAGAPKAGYRMLAAIVESNKGSVFFKFAGPKKTVTAGEAEFKAMLSSIKPE